VSFFAHFTQYMQSAFHIVLPPSEQPSLTPEAGWLSRLGKIATSVQGTGALFTRAAHRSGLARFLVRLRHREKISTICKQLSELPVHRQELAEAMEGVGKHFADIGEVLDRMTDAGSNLVSEGQRLLILASGRSDGETVLESAIALLHTPLDFLQTCATSLETFIARLEKCESQIREILTLRAKLEDTIAPLNYIQKLYKIESARLDPELRQMFVAVSQDIAHLEAKVAGMFREKFALLGTMHTTIGAVLNHLRSVLPVHRRLGREKKQQIANTLVELQLELEKNVSRDLRLSSATRAITGEIGNVVVGLQFHDILTQKTQHLNQSFEQSQAHTDNLKGRSGNRLVDTLFGLSEANRLQSAHLSAIRHDLGEAMDTISAGIEQTINHTRQLDESCVALTELNKVTVAPDGMIQILLDTIHETREIVTSTVTQAVQAHEQLTPIEAMAQSLTSTMTDLSVTMHHIALNAQIQAVRLGEGTGLEVLAATTVEVSFATTTFSNEALEKLNGLATAITQVTADFANLRTSGREHTHILETRGRRMESELHSLRDRSLVALAAVGTHTQSIQTLAHSVLDHCRPDPCVECRLEDADVQLKAISGNLTGVLKGLRDSRETPSGDWKGRYTMASERDLHAAVLGQQAAPITSMVDHAEANTELFDLSAPADLLPMSSPAATPERTEPQASKKEAEASLGANVDLF